MIDASMGPRSRERGNTEAVAARLPDDFLLQWGRAHVSAEMIALPAMKRSGLNRFNGAALT